jgi:hypothetical protein
MSDESDQRTELDDLLVVIRKLQRQAPDPGSIKRAEDASRHISGMVREGKASEAHLRIREQLEERLEQLRCRPK